MREIKFRVWDLAVGAMIVPSPTDGAFHIDQNGVVKIPGTNKPLNHCVLEQHTGLKDKNGVEIYEGDVVHMGFYAVDMDAEGNAVETHDFSAEWTGPVEYQCGDGCGFYVGGDIPLMGEADVLERLGNIHENPELLETR